MTRREDEFSDGKSVQDQNTTTTSSSSSFLQRLHLRLMSGPGLACGMRRGLIVLGPESTFRASRSCSNQSLNNHCKTVGVGVPCVRSGSMTDSELFSRGRGCSRRWCVCLVLAVLFVSLGAAAGIYFA